MFQSRCLCKTKGSWGVYELIILTFAVILASPGLYADCAKDFSSISSSEILHAVNTDIFDQLYSGEIPASIKLKKDFVRLAKDQAAAAHVLAQVRNAGVHLVSPQDPLYLEAIKDTPQWPSSVDGVVGGSVRFDGDQPVIGVIHDLFVMNLVDVIYHETAHILFGGWLKSLPAGHPLKGTDPLSFYADAKFYLNEFDARWVEASHSSILMKPTVINVLTSFATNPHYFNLFYNGFSGLLQILDFSAKEHKKNVGDLQLEEIKRSAEHMATGDFINTKEMESSNFAQRFDVAIPWILKQNDIRLSVETYLALVRAHVDPRVYMPAVLREIVQAKRDKVKVAYLEVAEKAAENKLLDESSIVAIREIIDRSISDEVIVKAIHVLLDQNDPKSLDYLEIFLNKPLYSKMYRLTMKAVLENDEWRNPKKLWLSRVLAKFPRERLIDVLRNFRSQIKGERNSGPQLAMLTQLKLAPESIGIEVLYSILQDPAYPPSKAVGRWMSSQWKYDSSFQNGIFAKIQTLPAREILELREKLDKEEEW